MIPQEFAGARRYRMCLVNGVFVSDGLGEDGRVQPPGLFATLANELAVATGQRAWALWPYRSKHVFSIRSFATMTRRTIADYADYLAGCIREDLAADPLEPDESLAFVAYSGGTPVAQTAATLLRQAIPIGAFVFFGPALLPGKVPRDWVGDASVSCILGEQDWVQGVFPRVPQPWRGGFAPGARARLLSHLPASTAVRTLPCDHWPGYFRWEMRPHLVSAVADLLRPAVARGQPQAAR